MINVVTENFWTSGEYESTTCGYNNVASRDFVFICNLHHVSFDRAADEMIAVMTETTSHLDNMYQRQST